MRSWVFVDRCLYGGHHLGIISQESMSRTNPRCVTGKENQPEAFIPNGNTESSSEKTASIEFYKTNQGNYGLRWCEVSTVHFHITSHRYVRRTESFPKIPQKNTILQSSQKGRSTIIRMLTLSRLRRTRIAWSLKILATSAGSPRWAISSCRVKAIAS